MKPEYAWKRTKVGEWLDAKFWDFETGEVFFVELKKQEGMTMEQFILECHKIAADNFEDPTFVNLYDKDTADILGYDTY